MLNVKLLVWSTALWPLCNYTDCTITPDVHQRYITYLTGGAQDATGRNTFGWVEKDGDLGDGTGPTSPEEIVYVDQIVDPNVVINLNPCFRWYLMWLACNM